MRRFELREPGSLLEACRVLAETDGAKLIAGGTALLILIKQGVYLPGTLVNLKKVSGASEINYESERGLRIGALASLYEVETAPAVREHYPMLSQAYHAVASVRIRNLATAGGNLAHADHQSDPPAALVALEARVELAGIDGTREVPLAEFLLGSYETALEPGEIVSAVLVPPPLADAQSTYTKFTTGSSGERPCVGIAATVRGKDGVCEEARLVIGAVSPIPVRVGKAEELVRGQRLTAEVIDEAASEAARAVEPIDDLRGSADYKRHVVRVLVQRTLAACAIDGAIR